MAAEYNFIIAGVGKQTSEIRSGNKSLRVCPKSQLRACYEFSLINNKYVYKRQAAAAVPTEYRIFHLVADIINFFSYNFKYPEYIINFVNLCHFAKWAKDLKLSFSF